MDTTDRKVHITHPFHPHCGRQFELISRQRHWGEDRVVYSDDDGRLRTISAAFTDVIPLDEFRFVAGGRAAFRTVDLMTLCELLDRLGARRASSDA
ncbi:DUF5372 family protein [Bradyrhizobium sp.]|jgi:hypothetical protein|uniref:DUF5372 family protein n=1 Tax=Bradyrhizobium sp. TaxID=376 RepID=UPI003C47ABEC